MSPVPLRDIDGSASSNDSSSILYWWCCRKACALQMKGRVQTVPLGLLWRLFCSVTRGCEGGFVGRGAQGLHWGPMQFKVCVPGAILALQFCTHNDKALICFIFPWSPGQREKNGCGRPGLELLILWQQMKPWWAVLSCWHWESLALKGGIDSRKSGKDAATKLLCKKALPKIWLDKVKTSLTSPHFVLLT